MVRKEVVPVSAVTATRNPTLADLPTHENICAIIAISAIRVISGITVIRAATGTGIITGITGPITARTQDITIMVMRTVRQEKNRGKFRNILPPLTFTTAIILSPGFSTERARNLGRWV